MNQQSSNSLFWYRVRLVALIAVFLSPFIGGWFAFYVFDLRPPSGNYGMLVEPVKKIDWPVLESVDGRRFDAGFGRKWTFVLFSGDNCDEQCFSNLFYMRQIRTLLGRDTMRLQNVLITAQPLGEKLRTFLLEYPNLIVIENNREHGLYSQFALDGFDEVGSTPRMYLIDPDQNLMLHYPVENDQNRVLEDIKKLMKLSQIG
ncbi:MAG: hypothetical protein OEN02_01550 [Gammaproteobacteria bacterium]|nr:hypothetical protein [Gammaproteobacteria bacterium]